jgi:hypothetical protein
MPHPANARGGASVCMGGSGAPCGYVGEGFPLFARTNMWGITLRIPLGIRTLVFLCPAVRSLRSLLPG